MAVGDLQKPSYSSEGNWSTRRRRNARIPTNVHQFVSDSSISIRDSFRSVMSTTTSTYEEDLESESGSEKSDKIIEPAVEQVPLPPILYDSSADADSVLSCPDKGEQPCPGSAIHSAQQEQQA